MFPKRPALIQRRHLSSIAHQFSVSSKNGFLPLQDPLEQLPERFEALEGLLQEMPLYHNHQGSSGLLYKGRLGDASTKIPLYDVSNIKDSRLLSALFRDYSFWASAYLLEPCDILYRNKEDYGLGRQALPKNIAVPLVQLADKIRAKPFMEYALSYALYNWKRLDKNLPVAYDNLELIRSFSGLPSESGFILVHVAMVAHTPKMVQAVFALFQSIRAEDRQAFNDSIDEFCHVLALINQEMETMWTRSKHADYQKFRTFIMGVKNQPMFPHGVVYEGVSAEPMAFRGESGANDSIIPTADNLLELFDRMPSNPLTAILKDFRQYRPVGHQIFLSYVYDRAKELRVRDFALSDSLSALKYLQVLDQIRDFRWRHWNFTKEYILKYSKHPVATGGSPIVTWLPNQLKVVLEAMTEVVRHIKPESLDSCQCVLLDELKDRAATQHRVLLAEVEKLRQAYPGQDF